MTSIWFAASALTDRRVASVRSTEPAASNKTRPVQSLSIFPFSSVKVIWLYKLKLPTHDAFRQLVRLAALVIEVKVRPMAHFAGKSWVAAVMIEKLIGGMYK